MKVAILMPVFNCEETINQTITSLLAQTHADFTLYIVNNGCTDSTVEKIKSFKDSRIKIYNYTKIQKCSAALNYGFKKITEELIARADGDNIYTSNYLKNYIDLLGNTSYKVVYGSYTAIYTTKNRLETTTAINDKDLLIWRLMFFNTIDHSVMYRKNFITEIGLYNQLLHSEDYDLWLRCILKDINSIGAIDPEYKTCHCIKNSTCMTEKYGQANNINVTLSKQFINKFLGMTISSKILQKIKYVQKLNINEIFVLNSMLTIYLQKMNISKEKFLKNKKTFQFYV